MTTQTFTKTAPPAWLLAMWKEIDDKTFGKGFDCFAEDAVCHLGVADWHGREAIRNNLRQFIDKGFTALHEVVEFWDSPLLKIFHGFRRRNPSLRNDVVNGSLHALRIVFREQTQVLVPHLYFSPHAFIQHRTLILPQF